MTSQINAIIAQYIANETRIIIPEIGTLLRRKESGEIVFMEMLKKNDGTLATLIVNTLDVSPSKSAEILNEYIAEIQRQLATSKKFILDGVGVLLARTDGGLDFSFNLFAQSLPEPTREESVVIPAKEAKVEEPKVVEVAPVVTEEPKVEQTKEAPEVVESPKTEPTVAPKAEPVVAEEPKAKPVVTPKVEEVTPAPKAEPKPAVKPVIKPIKPVVNNGDDDEDEAPRKPRIAGRRKRIKIDGLTIVAIIAVIMAIITLVWGFSSPEENQPLSNIDSVQTENVSSTK